MNKRHIPTMTLLMAALLMAGNAMAEGEQTTTTGVRIGGSVYGGGNLADVKTNTEVNMGGGSVAGNVFGGGKGEKSLFTCEKAMVGVEGSGAGANLTTDENKDKGTIVTISNGTVGTLEGEEGSQTLKEGTGNVYGGGEIGRVEWNTQVKIGVGTGEGTFAPVIYGSVFGAGKGLATHGYSALVRGNSTVTIQGGAQVGYNVYGGGEMSTVGRYWVKGINNNVDGAPEAPEDLPVGMPYQQQSGGICSVTIQGSADIGYNGATDEKGHVFGAGKGVSLPFVASGEGKSQKMTNTNVMVDFNDEGEYLEFLQTLSLVTNSYVTIDGSAKVKGSVYGGSESGFVQHVTNVTIKGSNCEIGTTTYGDVFGGGRGLESFAEAGKVKGTTTVAITAGAVKGNVYGGGELGDVGTITKPADYNYIWTDNTGICTVTISGGTIGIDNPTDASEHGNVFGAGKGLSDTFWCEKAIAYKATVEITDGKVKGNVYGGGQIGRVETDTEVTIGAVSTGGTGEGTDSGEESGSGESTTPPAPVISGSVFGAGAGAETHGYSALVRGDTKVTIQGYAQVAKNVYGGGEKASVGRYGLNAQKMPNILVGGGRCEVDVKDHATIGEDVFGAGKGIDPVFDENNKPQRMTAVNGVSTWESFDTADAYFTFLETLALVTHPEVTIDGSATIGRSVFGGGELGLTKGSVIVNIKGGTIGEDVYGGGALANTNTTKLVADNYPTTTPTLNADGSIKTKEVSPTTSVNLLDGTIMGDAYGGGLGQLGDNPVEAVVYGDITVTLGEDNSDSENPAQATKFHVTTYEGKTIVKSGRIFGCNNLNGSPQGDVTVRVWNTVPGNVTRTAITRNADTNEIESKAEPSTYEVAAVYGGGNLANYTATGKKTNVIIETCDVSIESVYGGGNAAAVPQTDVLVKGAYEIGTVFGGGNGKDQYTLDGGENWITNPGANVNGNANTLLTGGYVHEAYGGSNEKGTITGDVTIDVGQGGYCDLDLGKLVGAGKNADVNGDLKIIMGCKPEVKVPLVFGGADNANVNGNVELTITSGKWGTVVGGNNNGGVIKGHIILNIEETTCIPINIDELYGCGYNALYSQYGYYVKTTTSEGENATGVGAPEETPVLTDGKLQFMPRQSADDPHLPVDTYSYSESSPSWTVLPITGDNKFEGYASPEVNIISCTSIGQVFGGGYGATATVYGNPTVNINMVPGAHASKIDRDGDENADNDATLLGEIGHVYGGGNQAAVYGNTKVNIGTKTTESVYVFADPNTEDDVEEYVLQYDETEGVAPKTPKTLSKDVTGAYITGNVYGGGNEADVTGNTFVNICAKYDDVAQKYLAVSQGTTGVLIGGDVFGGGKGKADTFKCEKAMVGTDGAGLNADYADGNTNVVIGNGTINGTVYGGGQIGRVERNTTVTIGIGEGTATGTLTSAPEIKGNVFGAGAGEEEHGYAALVRGNPTVTIQGNAKVRHSVYGGGEIASVARYNVPKTEGEVQQAIAEGYTEAALGMPYALKDASSGTCTVIVRGYAEIGPETAMQMTKAGGPDDTGYVFGAGKGILPGGDYEYEKGTTRRMVLYDATVHTTVGQEGSKWQWVDPAHSDTNKNVWEYFADLEEYIKFIQTLALSSRTDVTITGNAFVKGSVYGGSENGIVQFNTNVTIQGGQIGAGDGMNVPYKETDWAGTTTPTNGWKECASWLFQEPYAPYDPYATNLYNGQYYYDSNHTQEAAGGASVATDGHTYYGNVFGGGSGCVPYFDHTLGRSVYLHSAGQVKGDTHVTISGGHILTNVYGGCEATNVNGTANVTMTGGTIGVPRTDAQIIAHPLTGYIFGGGKGDQRIFFNKDTNVKDAVVTVEGGRIYGSVYGGGEDGHVLRNVTLTIGKQTTTGEGNNAVTTTSGPKIGTKGTSYYDGHVFGGGRGFGGDALTAGNVGGSVDVNILDGDILGSVYGGGRLASVGYGLYLVDEEVNGEKPYGIIRPDNEYDGSYTNPSTESPDDFFTKGRGHINMTISGGTIGNDDEYTYDANSQLSHTKGGNVYAGGMGRMYKLDGTTPISSLDWSKLGCVKSTKLTITGGTIRSNVYGGGELGQVVGHHTAKNAANEDVNASTEIIIQNTNNTIIGTEMKESVTTTTTNENNEEVNTTSKVTKYTFGSVFGGGYGSLIDEITVNGVTSKPKFIAGLVKEDTKIDMQGGEVKASIYGGGEMASVGEKTTSGNVTTVTGSTYVSVSGGTVGIAPITVDGSKRYFGGAKMGNVYGGGSGHGNTVRSGKIFKNTYVTISGSDTRIFHNIYGGGAYGTVGDFSYTEGSDGKVTGINDIATTGTGVATVTITGGTIGYDGNENGMVFGSSRGDINRPDARDDYTAWVYKTYVTIGEKNAQTGAESGPSIKGTVYGSGENGHTFNNTVVTVNGGKIGIDSETDPGYTITSNGKTYYGAAYPNRGNVYGGGCGTDKYYEDPESETHDGDGQLFNSLAGVVYGNATVNITGGTVVHNVYGAGAMGSVGKTVSTITDGVTIKTTTGGLTTINVSGGTIGVSGTVGDGNVFGAARGDAAATSNEFALVRKETNVSVTGGIVKGNVYGGGELGCVGVYGISTDYSTFTWKDTDGTTNTAANSDKKNTGICNVTVDGSAAINGHVFGAGKGKDDTFWCEKGIAYKTVVHVSNGTVNGNVYGGGEVGRVETDTEVKVGITPGEGGAESKPTINGSVFGGGAGVETHGYSALVRGNTTVTVDQAAKVEHSVYGGGEIASVGKYGLDEHKMPSILKGGGYCYVTVKGSATIAEDVFGAGKGVTPHFDKDNTDHSKRSRRMTVYNSTDFPDSKKYPAEGYTWEYYENYPSSFSGTKFVWDYLPSLESYSTYLETLALVTHPEVTIEGSAAISGSVFGGGELGLTKGSVVVNIQGGTITEDVYGGGSLANTNTTSLVDLDGDGNTEEVHPITTVNLKGGTVIRNVYGGGLGQLAKAAVNYTQAEANAYNTEHNLSDGDAGFMTTADVKVAAQSAIPAKVYGDVLVKLNETTATDNCVVKGKIFGCNNLNGSPQSAVTVHIYKTTDYAGHEKDATKSDSKYNVEAVYGGGNLAAFIPDNEATADTAVVRVIIDGCTLTSIGTVYGGGNAASVSATEVTVNSAYEIGQVFGGGNGYDNYQLDGIWYQNPGANVGYKNYTHWVTSSVSSPGTQETPYQLSVNNNAEDETAHQGDPDYKDASDKAKRLDNFAYGIGKAHATIYGGTVHAVYGGSNSRGNVRVEARTTLEDKELCSFEVGEAFGGGNNAPQDGDAVLEIGCISGLEKAYGGAANADINGNVVLNITNGTYDQVFGGNDAGGAIRGSITVNIEETGCNPIIIGELYGGGCNAAYSVYGYDSDNKPLKAGDEGANPTPVRAPVVNVKSFTSIGNIYGGGYGVTATMVGSPEVNINVVKGKYSGETSEEKFTNRGFVLENDPNITGKKRYSKEIDKNGTPHTVYVPAHDKDAIGAIYNVFGGGNAAKVIGTPHVMVGTQEYVEITTNLTDVRGYCTRTGAGTQNSPYIYSEPITGDKPVAPTANTSYYKKVVGVDIRGDVYGGGNQADVEGDTNVVIGKKVP